MNVKIMSSSSKSSEKTKICKNVRAVQFFNPEEAYEEQSIMNHFFAAIQFNRQSARFTTRFATFRSVIKYPLQIFYITNRIYFCT